MFGWFAPAAVGAALLDACPPGGTATWGVLSALELVIAVGLLAALARTRGVAGLALWRTPLDGRIAGALAVLVAIAGPWRENEPGSGALRLVVSVAVAYYALFALLARDPRVAAIAWRAFPLAVAGLSAHSLWAATHGLAHLAEDARAADARWGGEHSLVSALVIATALTAGRACERGAPPAWRLAALVGAVGIALHVAAAGLPYDARSLGRLEDPYGFSAVMVIAVVLHRFGSLAWALRRERPAEAGRWWGVLAAVALLAGEVLCGAGPRSEGLALMAALAAGLVAAAHATPASGAAPAAIAPPEPLARAA